MGERNKANKIINYLENDNNFNPVTANDKINDFKKFTKKKIEYLIEFELAAIRSQNDSSKFDSSVWQEYYKSIPEGFKNASIVEKSYNFYKHYYEKLENVKKKVSDYEKLKSDYNKNTLKRMFQTKPEEPQKPSYYDNYKENEVKNNEIIDFLMELIEKI